jgi:hypothetical protein
LQTSTSRAQIAGHVVAWTFRRNRRYRTYGIIDRGVILFS